MRIQNCPINNNYRTSFTGYTCLTHVPKEISPLEKCISESHLMRNLDSTIFARDYLNEMFRLGGKILVPGCSLFEGYTWAALLNKCNIDKRFKIHASDIIPDVVEDAKKGILPIGRFLDNSYDRVEKYLVKTSFLEQLSKNKKEAKSAFMCCFKKARQTDCVPTNGVTSAVLDKNIKYEPKKDVFKGVLDFSVGNVFDLDKKYDPKSVIAVSFRNALYHVLGVTDQADFINAKLDTTQILFEKFHKMLKKDGVFLLGALPTEHLLLYPTRNTKFLYQGNELIETSHTRIHELLKNTGFEPIFYELTQVDVHLPTVWKKV